MWYHFVISSRNVLFHIGDFVVEPLSGCQIFFLHSTLDKEHHSHLFFLFPTLAFFQYTQDVGNLALFLICNLQNLLQVTLYLPLQLVSLFCRIQSLKDFFHVLFFFKTIPISFLIYGFLIFVIVSIVLKDFFTCFSVFSKKLF